MSSVSIWLPTKSKIASHSYTWNIEHFSEKLQKAYDKFDKAYKLRSPVFEFRMMHSGNLETVKLYLWLILRCCEESNDSQPSQWLQLCVSKSSNMWVNRSLYTKKTAVPSRDVNNACIAWISGRQRERVSRLNGEWCEWYNTEFALYDDLFDTAKGLLHGDTLTIVYEVHELSKDVKYVDSWLFYTQKPAVVQNVDHTLVKDLKQFLETGQGSDVTLVAGDGVELLAHTLILCSRSPVFSAMFSHDTKENQEKRVVIQDIFSSAAAGLLEFMYTDTVSDITTLARNYFQLLTSTIFRD